MPVNNGRDLHVEHLSVILERGNRPVVRDVSFHIPAGGALGLVGESGSGKTITCRSILRLLPPGAEVSGKIEYNGRSLLDLSEKQMQAVRGSEIGMIFQDPMTALNPVIRVGTSISQVIRSHAKVDRRTAARGAVESLERVGIRNASARASAYPHQFSGGMRQRVLTAMAVAAKPTLLLADEPTTALDVIVQAGILEMFAHMRREAGMSLLLVSHDFAVVASLCERLAVMYAGEIVEEGMTQEVLSQPAHPYTFGLIQSIPAAERGDKLDSIPGSPPDTNALPAGCAFAPRCRLATTECKIHPIPLIDVSPTHRSRCIRIHALEELRSEISTQNITTARPPAAPSG